MIFRIEVIWKHGYEIVAHHPDQTTAERLAAYYRKHDGKEPGFVGVRLRPVESASEKPAWDKK